MGRDRRFQGLLDELRRNIGSSFSPSESLPSKRKLAAIYGVGETTIKRALHVLVAEGFVKVIPNVGTYRATADSLPAADISSHAAITVGLMTRRAAEEWPHCDIYQPLLEEASRRGIKVVAIPNQSSHRVTPNKNRIDLHRVPWNKFDVGLLVEAQHTISTRDPILAEHCVLAVDQDATEFGLDSVAFADARGGAMAARHLLDLGHSRFAVTDDFSDPSRLARRHGFEAVIGSAGGFLLPQWRLQVGRLGPKQTRQQYTSQIIRKTVEAWAALPAPKRPTALFCIDHSPLLDGRLIEALAQHRMHVPRDFSIVAVTWGRKFFGGTEPAWNGMRFTCIDFDLSALVRRVYEAAIELAAEKRKPKARPPRSPKLFLAPALLLPGQSTARPLEFT